MPCWHCRRRLGTLYLNRPMPGNVKGFFMGRPAKFSREQLQAAALALVDKHGLESLSMRALAAELGTGAMTLYNHVEHREDLEMLVVDAVVADTHWRDVEHEDW